MILTDNALMRSRLLSISFLFSVCAIGCVAANGQSLFDARESSKRPPTDIGRQLVFKTIDPLGGNCAMVFGGPSLGTQNFLIQDCGASTWKLKWNYDDGYVKRMSFVNERLGWWVIGHALVKVERIDDSLQATVVRNNQDENIDSVVFFDAQFGWICGSDGFIAKTDDGGATWQTQVTPTDFPLNQIRFVSALDGWASGGDYRDGRAERVLLTTNNGGANWAVETGEARNLSPIFFTSPQHGCGVDDNDSILCTNDGQTWRKAYSDKNGRKAKSAVFFLNENRGWIAGNGIWRTGDGGRTWTEQLSLSGQIPGIERLFFVNEQLGWAHNLQSVWRTNDGGKSWLKVSDAWLTRLRSQTSDIGANRIRLKSNRIGPK